jgi:hypothetical protein
MATAPLYNLEESIERSCVSVLTGITALAGLSITRADTSNEAELPLVAVRAERQDEVVLGMQTWNMRLAVTLTTAADETSDEEVAARRRAEPTDDDTGADGFAGYWKTLTDTLTAESFKTSLNAQEVAYVWGVEWEPTQYANGERTFSRTTTARIWASYAYAS